MQIEFLGTAGAINTPRVGCTCRICVEAREKGVPYSRYGPSLFVHGPDVLIDTPEEIKVQLNRSRVEEIKACFYSHWHPDHVMGRRVWEERNTDWQGWPPRNRQTDLYLPHQVAQDFRTSLGTWNHLKYFEQDGLVRLIELSDGDVVTLGDVAIRPFRLAEDFVYAFMLEGDGKRILIAVDDLLGWEPASEVQDVDLAILPMGVVEFNPFTGERQIPEAHPILEVEATFLQTLEIVRKLKASRVLMTHIEEPDQLSHDDLRMVSDRLRGEGHNVAFAYDTMLADV
jgi:phosphoribosyl 1,2-cyclic phosphate phosphodiesterase